MDGAFVVFAQSGADGYASHHRSVAMRYDGQMDQGCEWQYKGHPCTVVGVDVENNEVIALFINTGVGPDIRAEFEDLTYEVKAN